MPLLARFARRVAATTVAALTMSGAAVVTAATPAAANHVGTITVAQVGNDGSDVTLQVDVTYTGTAGGGTFSWNAGDGRSASVSDGVTNGVYAGDASGTGTMWNGSGRLATFAWERTQPAANVARTRIAYTYALAGVYTVDWSGCCPAVNGALPVSVAASLPACSDTLDNDGDGSVDHPDDPGCATPDDASERAECPPVTPGVVACLVPGQIVLDAELRHVDVVTGPAHTVAGWLDRYRFQAGPSSVSLPCVRLAVDSTAPNACALAGGTFVERIATLFERTVHEPAVAWGPVVGAVKVCEAELVATVLGLGVDQAPAYTLCDAGAVGG